MKTKIFITDVEPWAMESPRKIRTAALSFRDNNGKNFNAFVPDWPNLDFEGMSLEELKSLLVGKEINAELSLMAYNLNIKKSLIPLTVFQSGKNAETKIIGKILNLDGPFFYNLNEKPTKLKYFCSDLDCGGVIINIQISESEKNKYALQVGDYIEAEGRLDIIINKTLEGKIK